MESSPTSTSTDTQTVPPSAPLELFLTNLKLYYDYFPFYKTNNITTLEQALNFRNFPSKLSPTEERKLRFLLINIRSLRESLPSSKSSQISTQQSITSVRGILDSFLSFMGCIQLSVSPVGSTLKIYPKSTCLSSPPGYSLHSNHHYFSPGEMYWSLYMPVSTPQHE
jgi:hypothetical protein